MLLIPCPYCGDRARRSSSAYGGEAHIARPADPAALDDAEWAAFLYARTNPQGRAHRALAPHPWLRPLLQRCATRHASPTRIAAALMSPADGTGDRPRRRSASASTAAPIPAAPATRSRSALLANGVHLIGPLVQVPPPARHPGRRVRGAERAGGRSTAARAGARPTCARPQVELYDGLVARSQNRCPSLRVRPRRGRTTWLAPLLPAGFYYKTFMWPTRAWRQALRTADPPRRRPRPRARRCRTPTATPTATPIATCWSIGAGPAGLAAALAAAAAGARVILCDEQAAVRRLAAGRAARHHRRQPGGGLAAAHAGRAARACPSVTAAAAHHGVRLLSPTTWSASPSASPTTSPTPTRAAARAAVAGARQRRSCSRPAPSSARWCSPATTGPASCWPTPPALSRRATASRPAAAPSSRPRTTAPTAPRSTCRRPASRSPSIADARADAEARWPARRATPASGSRPARACSAPRGRLRVRRVDRSACDGTARDAIALRTCVLMSGGWTPSSTCSRSPAASCASTSAIGAFLPDEPATADRVGACRGMFGLAAALADGARGDRRAGAPSPAAAHVAVAAVTAGAAAGPAAHRHAPSSISRTTSPPRTCALATREGFRSIEHVKRYTTTGMATDQGKTSNINALAHRGRRARRAPIPEVGLTTFRRPTRP